MTLWTPDKLRGEEPLRVLLKRGEFTDHSRDGRVIPYKIYYPVEHGDAPLPLVLWSHGFGGNRDGASFISRELAARGYVVAHMTHIGTDSSLWEGKPGHPWDILRDVKIPREVTLARMYDVPFFLSQLPELFAREADIGAVDFSRVGMSGHSFGAMTTQVMAGMKFPDLSRELVDLRDSRIKAGILYSPVPIAHLTDAPHANVYGGINIPIFHMTGTQDVSPLEGYGYEHRLLVRDHAGHPEQYLQVLQDGDHMVYNGTRGQLGINPNREVHEREIINGTLAFWEAYLKDEDGAKEWLRTHYGQTGKDGG